MNIETMGIGTLIVVVIMAVVTLVTRWGGVFVMSFVPIGHRVKQFIGAMSGSVLVALLAPLAMSARISRSRGVISGSARRSLSLWAMSSGRLRSPLATVRMAARRLSREDDFCR